MTDPTRLSDGPDGLSPESRLLYADLAKAADELAYRNAPVECRTSQAGLRFLRLAFGAPRTPPTPLDSLYYGLRVIVDPDVPENRIEFRDKDGHVVQSIELTGPVR
jgi:hypothetical protein